MKRSFNLMAAASAVALGTLASPAFAAWPDRPINIIVPYAPGGTADALARLIGQQLGTKLNTPVVIQNKAGASGIIGADTVAKAAGTLKALAITASQRSLVALAGAAEHFDARARLGEIRARTFMLQCTTDRIFPSNEESKRLLSTIPAPTRYHELESPYGHMASGVALAQWRNEIAWLLGDS